MTADRPFAAAATWPAEPPLEMLEPDEHGDDLDGVTREQLVAAQIAKHKEVLTPTTPAQAQSTPAKSNLLGE